MVKIYNFFKCENMSTFYCLSQKNEDSKIIVETKLKSDESNQPVSTIKPLQINSVIYYLMHDDSRMYYLRYKYLDEYTLHHCERYITIDGKIVQNPKYKNIVEYVKQYNHDEKYRYDYYRSSKDCILVIDGISTRTYSSVEHTLLHNELKPFKLERYSTFKMELFMLYKYNKNKAWLLKKENGEETIFETSDTKLIKYYDDEKIQYIR